MFPSSYANMGDELEKDMQDDGAISPKAELSRKFRTRLRKSKETFSQLDDILNTADVPSSTTSPPLSPPPTSPKPVIIGKPSFPPSKPVVSAKPSNGGGAKPPTLTKPNVNSSERPVPMQRKHKPKPGDVKPSDRSASPIGVGQNIVFGAETRKTPPNPVARTPKEGALRSISVDPSIPADRKHIPSNPQVTPLVSPRNKQFENQLASVIGKKPGEVRPRSFKRPGVAPPKTPSDGVPPKPPPASAKPTRHEYEPVSLQPPKKETDDDDKVDYRQAVHVTPVQRTNLRRFSDDENAKEHPILYAQSMRRKQEESKASLDPDIRPRRTIPKQQRVTCAISDYEIVAPMAPGRYVSEDAFNDGMNDATYGQYNDVDYMDDDASNVGVYGTYNDVEYLQDKHDSNVGLYGQYKDVEYVDDKSDMGTDVGVYGQYKDVDYMDEERWDGKEGLEEGYIPMDSGREDAEALDTPSEILARGPKAREAYQKALEDGFKHIHRTRIMFVGQERVGKTTLMKILSGKRFDEREKITDGIDTNTLVEVAHEDRDKEDFLWRLQEAESTDFTQQQLENAVCSFVLQRLKGKKEQNGQDIEQSGPWDLKVGQHILQTLLKGDHNKTSEHVKAGGEETTEKPAAFTDIPETIAKKLQELLESREDYSKDNDCMQLQMWDFGGHDIYYTTHQVFLNHRAIYILTFDLSLDLHQHLKRQIIDEVETQSQTPFHELTGLGFLHFWMQSVYAYATRNQPKSDVNRPQLSPPIFIVGTHRDNPKISIDPVERKCLVKNKFEDIYDMLKDKPYEQHVVSRFYAVENSLNDQEDEELSSLRKHIVSVARKEPYMGKKIPLKWFKFENAIAETIKEGQHFMKLEQVHDICRQLTIQPETIPTMLQFYHDLYTIIHFGSSKNTYLQDIVILDPQWLINIFKRVITVKPRRQQWATMKNLWRRLKEEGILEDRLIDHVWHDLLQQKTFLLALMEMFDLLVCPQTPATQGDGAGGTCTSTYYVPACLEPCLDEDMCQKLSCSEQDICIFYIDFKEFLPDGFFNRLLVRAARWSQEHSDQKPKLYYRCGNFCLDDDHDFQLKMQTSPICVKVTIFKTPVESPHAEGTYDRSDIQPDSVACASVKEFLNDTLDELTQTWIRGIKYEFAVACPCNQSSNESTSYHLLPLESCLTKENIRCCHTQKKFPTAFCREWFQGNNLATNTINQVRDLNRPNIENYAKVCEAIYILCSMSLPTLKACVQQWHWSQKQVLQPCSASPTCKCVPHKKPTNTPGACQSCKDWTQSLGRVCHPPGKQLQWKNVDASKFHKDPVEVAKAFLFIIPSGQQVAQFGDFDVGGILKLMIGFGLYHQRDEACYKKMEKVVNIRNKLSHMKIEQNMAIPDTQLAQWFDDMKDLANSLKSHQAALDADKIKRCLIQIKKSDATPGMISRAEASLSDGLKQLHDEWKKGMAELGLQLHEVRSSQQRQEASHRRQEDSQERQEQQLADIKAILLSSTQQR